MVARYVRSLTPLTPLTRSAAQRSVHWLAHSLCSLPRETVEIFEYVFTLLSRFTGTNAFLALTRNTPLVRLNLDVVVVVLLIAGNGIPVDRH